MIDTSNSFYSEDKVVFKYETESLIKEYEFVKPIDCHPFIELIFKYLNSKSANIYGKANGFQLLGRESKHFRIKQIDEIYQFTDKFKCFKKGTIEDFFKKAIAEKATHSDIYKRKNLFKLLLAACYQLGVDWSYELKKCHEEIPVIPLPKNIPFESLGQALMAKNSAAEKSLFNGLQFLWADAWNNIQKIRAFFSKYHQHEVGNLSAFSIWYELLTQDSSLISESNIAIAKSKYIDGLSVVEARDFLVTRLDHENKKLKSSMGRHRSNLKLPSKFMNLDFVSKPTAEEHFIVWSMLSKYSFSLQGLKDLKLKDISFNSSLNSIQVSSNKSRGQAAGSVRTNLAVFQQAQDGFLIMKEYKNLMINLYQEQGMSEQEAEDAPAFYYSEFSALSLGFITECYLKSPSWQDSRRWLKIKEFIDHWSQIERLNLLKKRYEKSLRSKDLKHREMVLSEVKKNGFKTAAEIKVITLTPTNLSQSGKLEEFEYQISDKGDSQDSLMPSTDSEISEEVSSALRNHSLAVDVNTYFARSQSKIMLDAFHRVGAQVGNAMVDESKELAVILAGKVSLKEIREFTGSATESESLSTIEGFGEFINKSGYSFNDFFGIQEGEKLIIIQHPVILAIIKDYIHFIDINLDKLLHDQGIKSGGNHPRKIAEVESLRAVLQIISEYHFDETLHVQADAFIEQYEMPSYQPLF